MKKRTYTKRDIVKQVAKQTNSSYDQTAPYVDEIFSVMRGMMSKSHDNIRIEVRNFGVFEVKPTRAKPRARNPRTNEEVFVPAHKKSHFKPGKILKQHLKQPI
ncbi:MAG: integration host factor subunit beta [Planctomycetia bacterium]|nr:integration host factor subunit beta [Planctomycetia bacterium]